MELTLYSFSKRVNSTARPSGGTVVDVLLKEPTDLHRPVFKCQLSSYGKYNMAKFIDNYYWIESEIAFPNNWIEYVCRIDSMATCALEIKNTIAYVERAGQGTTNIIDDTMPQTTSLSLLDRQSFNLAEFETAGCYLLSVVGGLTDAGVSGVATTYAISSTLLRSLSKVLSSDAFLQQMVQYFYDPYSAIVSCIWVPFLPEDFGNARGSLYIGNYDTGVTATVVTEMFLQHTKVIQLPLDDTYLSTSRFTRMRLFLPFVGEVQLNPEDFLSKKKLELEWRMDCLTGAIIYNIICNDVVATYSGTCGVETPVGKSTYNPISMVTGALTAAAGVVTGNPIVAGGGFIGLINGTRSQSQLNGGFGSRAGVDFVYCTLIIERWGTPESITNRAKAIGLPFCRTVALGSLSGYVKCNNASISSSHEIDVIEECNNYLNSGAFIE